jgi:1,2-diacylglycerol 3-alpha-glucosyltransferase
VCAPSVRSRGALRVLMLSDVYFPRVNGVSTSIASFRGELPAFEVATTLVAPSYGANLDGDDVVRLSGRPVPFDPEDRFVPARRFVAAARRLPFDLLHVQTPFAAHRAGVSLARSRGVPLVETWHTDFEHYFEHYARFLPSRLARATARGIARRVARAVDRLVVPTAAVGAALTAVGVTTPIAVVPTGLAPGEFEGGDGARFREHHGIAPERPVAVHVGRMAHEKNLRFLLEAIALARRQVPDLLLVVAGEGPARQELEREAAALGMGTGALFVGNLERRRELPDAYRAGDLFVFASKTETQGLVLLEAMALGVPVVALAEQGTCALLAAGRGALVPRDDRQAFADAVVRLVRDRTLRERLAAEGPQVARAWSATASAERMAALYRELVSVPAAQARKR